MWGGSEASGRRSEKDVLRKEGGNAAKIGLAEAKERHAQATEQGACDDAIVVGFETG